MYFQLLSGLHKDIVSGKSYVAGDVIQSDADLVNNFGSNKFRKLSQKEIAAMQDTGNVTVNETKEEQPKQFKRHKKVVNIAK